MKVIFLDIDGVLNGGLDSELGFDWFLPEAVDNLNTITRVTGAKLVVSSSWRTEMELPELADHLAGWGVEGAFVDATPVLNRWDEDWEAPCHRAEEIRSWLDAHPEVESFVVVDDADVFTDGLVEETFEDAAIRVAFVRTDGALGLSVEDAAEAVQVLS